MKPIADSILKLKKYFQLIGKHREVPMAEVLSTNEALKSFGKLWNEHPGDVMAVVALLEYKFISETIYTEEQVRAVKSTLGEMVKLLKETGKEWKEYEAIQAKKRE